MRQRKGRPVHVEQCGQGMHQGWRRSQSMHRLTQVWQGAPARSGQGTTLSDRWSSTKGVASSFAASVQGHTCLFLSRCLWHSFFFSSRLLLIYLFPPQKLLDFATIKSVFGANKYNGIELQKKKKFPGEFRHGYVFRRWKHVDTYQWIPHRLHCICNSFFLLSFHYLLAHITSAGSFTATSNLLSFFTSWSRGAK